MRWRSLIVPAVVIAFVAIAPALFGTFTITLMNYIGIYAIAALGLVLLTGVGGLTSFGQAAFVGIGAYATAWYTAVQGGSPWIGLLLGLALAGVVATVLGAATLRLGGHFLPLSTIAWGIAIYFVFGNLDALNRYSGLSGIPPISIGSLTLGSTISIYYFIWIVVGLVMLLCRNLLDSRQGRAIRSLRGGAAMVESFAVDFFRTRLAVFVLAGLLAGLSGYEVLRTLRVSKIKTPAFVQKKLHGTAKGAHLFYFGAVAFEGHGLYAMAAGLMLIIVVISLFTGTEVEA